jgi:hypothetical protein
LFLSLLVLTPPVLVFLPCLRLLPPPFLLLLLCLCFPLPHLPLGLLLLLLLLLLLCLALLEMPGQRRRRLATARLWSGRPFYRHPCPLNSSNLH